jgi:catechol 2,3-dioxygenase-like lactoylglutathione lyase family enzyme
MLWTEQTLMNPLPMQPLDSAHLRIARPTDRLHQVVDFYKSVLGFAELGRFEDHDGFDGVMLGYPGVGYHFEFTHAHGHQVGSAPTHEDLLVFYVPDADQWSAVITHIENHGVAPVPAFNPYWDRQGKTYEDPDGYRVVIQRAAWQAS